MKINKKMPGMAHFFGKKQQSRTSYLGRYRPTLFKNPSKKSVLIIKILELVNDFSVRLIKLDLLFEPRRNVN